MDGIYRIERRKACDVCYHKKIKCNMAKPSCSNCELYQTPCKTSLIRRRAQLQPKSRVKSQGEITSGISNEPNNDSAGSETQQNRTLEERVAYLESQLSQFAQSPPKDDTPPDNVVSWSGIIPMNMESRLTTSTPRSKHRSDINQSLDRPSPLVLPPLDDILPFVERYFEHTNSLIPLFDKSDFYKLLVDWYHPSSNISQAHNAGHHQLKKNSRQTTFAAINVVIGLSFRVPSSPSQGLDLGEERPMVEQCRRNAERMVMDLMNTAEDLVVLQVLLGLMMLYLGSQNPHSVTTLVGSAVQLCHRLRLHSSEENADFQPPVRIKRERLFWITYILDKEVSIRYHTPPLLSDDEADVELSMEQEGSRDTFSDIIQDSMQFNFFCHRVHLAGTQALVYQQLYSRSSGPSKIPAEQRRSRVLLLDAHLENWRKIIPDQLQMDSLVKTLFPEGLMTNVSQKSMGIFIHMVQLHFAYIGLLVRIHGVWSNDADWLKLINSFSQQIVRDCSKRCSRCDIQLGPFPKQWERCVKASKECLRLVQEMPLVISSMWGLGCAYVSSLIIVLANQLQSNDIEQLEVDHALTKHGLVIFAKIKEASGWQPLHLLHSVIIGLDEQATRILTTRRTPSANIEDFESMAPDLLVMENLPPSEWDFMMY
ncbi:fungal-specific transcription factor domain-containing protein [Annulohypoxylon truncatum]|uniref:fungal-specific transcription factor domain-containing protein n=1 Tax=Annulohypoxylon truncatum TaxID=327061 RepID=UPI002008A16B|nr:fungal-specific transcription factor domain-containing protein [Annulohypoxylon truncatum]KAI1207282.1 fungal-specific transcription factor domain-containing protein [Annulohypoxylon truncatum]